MQILEDNYIKQSTISETSSPKECCGCYLQTFNRGVYYEQSSTTFRPPKKIPWHSWENYETKSLCNKRNLRWSICTHTVCNSVWGRDTSEKKACLYSGPANGCYLLIPRYRHKSQITRTRQMTNRGSEST